MSTGNELNIKPDSAAERLSALAGPDRFTHQDWARRKDLLKVLADVAKRLDVGEDASWRRKPRAKAFEDTGNYSKKTKQKAVVQCPGGHDVLKFKTPGASYTCDICFKSQAAGVTMHGCRGCNWDACVPCYSKALVVLRESIAAEEAQLAKENQKSEVELPYQTLKALVASFTIFEDDPPSLLSVFRITKVLAKDADFRLTQFRNNVSLAINKYCKESGICAEGFAALQNLCSNVTDITQEEARALVFLNTKAIRESPDNDEASEAKRLHFLLTLYDSSPDARTLIFEEMGKTQNTAAKVCTSTLAIELREAVCAFLSRFIALTSSLDGVDEERLIQSLEDIVRLYPGNDAICEQVYGVALALVNLRLDNDERSVNIISRLTKARFNTASIST